MYITSKQWISVDQLQTNSGVMRAKSKLQGSVRAQHVNINVGNPHFSQHFLSVILLKRIIRKNTLKDYWVKFRIVLNSQSNGSKSKAQLQMDWKQTSSSSLFWIQTHNKGGENRRSGVRVVSRAQCQTNQSTGMQNTPQQNNPKNRMKNQSTIQNQGKTRRQK